MIISPGDNVVLAWLSFSCFLMILLNASSSPLYRRNYVSSRHVAVHCSDARCRSVRDEDEP